jgi:hypothetical protein
MSVWAWKNWGPHCQCKKLEGKQGIQKEFFLTHLQLESGHFQGRPKFERSKGFRLVCAVTPESMILRAHFWMLGTWDWDGYAWVEAKLNNLQVSSYTLFHLLPHRCELEGLKNLWASNLIYVLLKWILGILPFIGFDGHVMDGTIEKNEQQGYRAHASCRASIQPSVLIAILQKL